MKKKLSWKYTARTANVTRRARDLREVACMETLKERDEKVSVCWDQDQGNHHQGMWNEEMCEGAMWEMMCELIGQRTKLQYSREENREMIIMWWYHEMRAAPIASEKHEKYCRFWNKYRGRTYFRFRFDNSTLQRVPVVKVCGFCNRNLNVRTLGFRIRYTCLERGELLWNFTVSERISSI